MAQRDVSTRKGLTPQQKRIVGYLELGLTDEQIARRLYIRETSVRGHVHRLCKVYRVRDRTELMRALVGRRVMELEHLIEHVLDAAASCPCSCCDQHYQALYYGSRD